MVCLQKASQKMIFTPPNAQQLETFQKQLKRVILIVSSSRGGSSVFTEYLRQSHDLLHLRAEMNPFLALCDLSYPHNSSDRLLATDVSQADSVWQWLWLECGSYKTQNISPKEWQNFSHDLQQRLALQWPDIHIPLSAIMSAQHHALERLRTQCDWDDDAFLDAQLFHLYFIYHLRQLGYAVDPRWYDLDNQLIQQTYGTLPPLQIPSPIVEEPPFVLISPWKKASAEDLATKCLVIKTPSNAYRLSFLRELFSKQTVALIHLKRQAKNSINGLYDGWRYPRGFHVHQIQDLKIKPCEPTGPHPSKQYWKYDLPPGWESYKQAPLTEVCAFQWYSAHHWIYEEQHLMDAKHSIWLADILANHEPTLGHLWEWIRHFLGRTDSLHHPPPITQLPLIMATRPRRRHTFARAALLEPTVGQAHIQEMMNRLKHDD